MIARSASMPSAYGEIFNVGAEKPYTVNELATLVMKAMGKEGALNHLEARNEVIDGPSSHVIAQAHNRLHAARGALAFLMGVR